MSRFPIAIAGLFVRAYRPQEQSLYSTIETIQAQAPSQNQLYQFPLPDQENFADNFLLPQASKTNIIYVSYGPLTPPPGTTTFIKARRKTPEAVKAEIASACSKTQRNILLLTPLNPLLSQHPSLNLAPYLLSLLALSPQTSLLAVYHIDNPLSPPQASHLTNPPAQPLAHQSPTLPEQRLTTHNPYAPAPLQLLSYLATTIFTLRSFPQVLAQKRARDRALPIPTFGMEEGKEGVIVGMGGNAYTLSGGGGGGNSDRGRRGGEMGEGGLVLEMEHRRKSGRSVHETYFLPPPPPFPPPSSGSTTTSSSSGALPSTSTSSSTSVSLHSTPKKIITKTISPFDSVIPLEAHPLFTFSPSPPSTPFTNPDPSSPNTTFSLSLTDKQRTARDGVILPYMDAQSSRAGGEGGGGGGEGGRILYDMGAEDFEDFDEEEDEI